MHIAIDGPAGAGKSTVAKKIAEKLNITYIDTGAMYRAMTYKVMSLKISFTESDKIIDIASISEINFINNVIYLDGQDVSKEIRKPIINKNVSHIAKIPQVRSIMVKIQQDIANKIPVVMDGRDIGSVVLPDANYKFYLEASLEERAKRRYIELKDKFDNITVDTIKREISVRDNIDTKRRASPLVKVKNAIVIDTSSKSIEEVVDEMLSYINE